MIAEPVRLTVGQLDAWEPKSTALIACQVRDEHQTWVSVTYEARRHSSDAWRIDIGRGRFEWFPSWNTFTWWLRQLQPRDIEMLIE